MPSQTPKHPNFKKIKIKGCESEFAVYYQNTEIKHCLEYS